MCSKSADRAPGQESLHEAGEFGKIVESLDSTGRSLDTSLKENEERSEFREGSQIFLNIKFQF